MVKNFDLNLEVLKNLGFNFEVVDGSKVDYGFVNIRFEEDLDEEDILKLKEEWIDNVKVWDDKGNEKEFVCCWGGGNVLCDNELGLNVKEDEECDLDFDFEDGCFGYYDFESYWNDVKGKIVGLDRDCLSIEIY